MRKQTLQKQYQVKFSSHWDRQKRNLIKWSNKECKQLSLDLRKVPNTSYFLSFTLAHCSGICRLLKLYTSARVAKDHPIGSRTKTPDFGVGPLPDISIHTCRFQDKMTYKKKLLIGQTLQNVTTNPAKQPWYRKSRFDQAPVHHLSIALESDLTLGSCSAQLKRTLDSDLYSLYSESPTKSLMSPTSISNDLAISTGDLGRA